MLDSTKTPEVIPLVYKKTLQVYFVKEAIIKQNFTSDYLLLRKRKGLLPNCIKGNMMLALQNKLLIVFHNICLQNIIQRH